MCDVRLRALSRAQAVEVWDDIRSELMPSAQSYEREAPTGAVEALEGVRQARSRADYRGARDLALAALASPSQPAGEFEFAALLIELGRLQDNLGQWQHAERTIERAAAVALALPDGPEAAPLRAR
jgi:hypothetical protein